MKKYPCVGTESPDLSLLPESIPVEKIWSDPELYLKAAEYMSKDGPLLLPLSNTLEAEAVGAPVETGPVRVRRNLLDKVEKLSGLQDYDLSCEHFQTILQIRTNREIVFGLSGLCTLISQISDLGRALVAIRKGHLDLRPLFQFYLKNTSLLLKAIPYKIQKISLADPPLAPDLVGPNLFHCFLEELYVPLTDQILSAGYDISMCPRLYMPMREKQLIEEKTLLRGVCLKRPKFQVYLNNWENEEKKLTVDKGTELGKLLKAESFPVEMPCNGAGTCGKCDVLVCKRNTEGWSQPERIKACEAIIHSDLKIWPVAEGTSDNYYDATRFELPKIQKVDCGSGEQSSYRDLGLAVDIGTTGVVMELLDLKSAMALETVSFLNPQKRFGLDVMARITAARDFGPDLQIGLINEIRANLQKLMAGKAHDSLKEICFSGNTAMLMLLRGEDPSPLGISPYRAPITVARKFMAADIGLEWPGNPQCMTLPVLSGHVGADVAGGVIQAGLNLLGPPALLMDVGTNNEIVLRAGERLLAASCAAGPALEGATIRFGSRAVAGAVEDVRFFTHPELKVIGEGEAKSICGSGILALVREALKLGLVDRRGRIEKVSHVDEDDPRRVFLGMEDGKPCIRLNEKLYVTQKDIRQVQLAKTAIQSGIVILMREAGMEAEDLKIIYLAGQFGAHLSGELLEKTGLLPDGVKAEVVSLGNSSLYGALAVLKDERILEEMNLLRERTEVFELSVVPDYERVFLACSQFPDQKEASKND